jgi:hypothetical protein
MADVFKAGVIISQSQSDSNQIRDIVHGQVEFVIPQIAADGVVKSASGVAMGVVAGMKVLLMPIARAASQQAIFAAAIGIDNGIQLTATNPSASAIATFNSSASFFAWR